MVLSAPAAAVTFIAGPANSGPIDVSSSYAPGYTLYTFNGGTSPFTGGAVESSSQSNQYAAPYGDTTPYFSVGPSTSSPASLLVSGITQLSFYWGSIDTYNKISFDGLGQSFTGADLGSTDSSVSRTSREVTFYLSSAEASHLTGITLSSSVNAMEVDNLIFGNAVPEPGTWAMMTLGVGAVGFMLRRRKTATRVRFA